MREKDKYALNEPTSGFRSENYIGIIQQMQPSWFHKTSHCKTSTIRHTTPIPLRRHEKETLQIRDEMVAPFLREQGLNGSDIKERWKQIIYEVSNSTTKKFLSLISNKSQPIADTPANRYAAEVAGEHGMAELHSLARKYTSKNAWAHMGEEQQIMGFCKAQKPSKFVYIRRQPGIVDPLGRKPYKIGDTKDTKQRSKGHHTSNPLWEKLNEYPCDDMLTESNIQNLFPDAPRIQDTRDWMWLYDHEYEKIKDLETTKKSLAEKEDSQ